jgi:predicted PurR-regulated permease PerM
VAVGVIYGLMFLSGLLFLRFGAPFIAEQAATIGAQLGEGYASVVQELHETPNLLLRRLAESLPDQPSLPAAAPADPAAEAESPFEAIGRYAGRGAMALFQIGAIFLIAFFWTIESERIMASAVSLLPLHRRDTARELIAEVEERVGGFVLGQLLLCLIIGALSLAAYLIIGLPYALALAVFVGIMEIIPFIGPIIGAIPSVIIGLSVSPATALWTVVASLIIHQLESNFFGPRVMKRTLNMRPLVTLLGLTAFGSLFGILGAIVALPLVSILQLAFDRILVEAPSPVEGSADRDRLGLLRYETQELVEDVRKIIRQREGESPEAEESESEIVEDTLEAIALDLDSLLASYRQTEAAS